MPLILIDKPSGMTSHDVVALIRKKAGIRQVGHTGTLDPMATGVMCVLVGRAVKASRYASAESKTYTASMRLGYSTDTGDVTGNVTEQTDHIPPFGDILSVIPAFTGNITQTPPAYSAIKRGGVKLCDAARRGEIIHVEPRHVKILSLSAEKTESPDVVILHVTCSKGTYIRTLCEDIAKAAGSLGTMSALRRTAQGKFDVSLCHPLDKVLEAGEQELNELLIPTETLFEDIRAVVLPGFYNRLCRNGCEIYLEKLGIDRDEYKENELVRLCGPDGKFFAVGRVGLYPDGMAVKTEALLEE
ncbi:MAG: tRNA pseudouridine(55) synthase TruB [Clostridia bacterium]|nr:tRNA pseudouridine(55) synthase TruB [Clostridia bacterium]